MKYINKAVNKSLFIAILLTVMLVGGIPAIVFGAISGLTILMVAGIVCTVIGFYGTPVAWVGFAEKNKLKRVVFAVTEEHLYTVQKISAQLQQDENTVRNTLTTCFNKGYLIGYVRDGDNVYPNNEKAMNEREITVKCDFCGAPFSYKISEVSPVCPYCGNIKQIEKK